MPPANQTLATSPKHLEASSTPPEPPRHETDRPCRATASAKTGRSRPRAARASPAKGPRKRRARAASAGA
eukprot:3488628-Lingulodinium_polyedra.AAC.1